MVTVRERRLPLRRAVQWPQWPVHTEETEAQLRAVLASGRWSATADDGGESKQVELAARFAEYNGVAYCVPVASGTAALGVALEALDVGAGDEVIVPGLCGVACPTSVLDVNAVPVLVDIELDSFCVSPAAVARAITRKTRAILAVHLYSSMVDMRALRAVAAAHDLPIIEDASHVHGAQLAGQHAGTFGDIGVFSTHQDKPLASGEGGIAITNHARLFDRMEQLRMTGRRLVETGALEERGDINGANASMSELQAALLVDGLTRLDEQNRRRADNARYLDRELGALGLVPLRRPAEVSQQTYYRYAIRAGEAFAGRRTASVCADLTSELGFAVCSPAPPLVRHPLYRPHSKRRYAWCRPYRDAIDPARYATPNAERAHAEGIVFHHSVLLGTRAQMEIVIAAFAAVQNASTYPPGKGNADDQLTAN